MNPTIRSTCKQISCFFKCCNYNDSIRSSGKTEKDKDKKTDDIKADDKNDSRSQQDIFRNYAGHNIEPCEIDIEESKEVDVKEQINQWDKKGARRRLSIGKPAVNFI